MQSRVQGGEETVVRIEREIDGDACLRRHGAGHFDVQHHLAIAPAIGTGYIGASGDANRRHVRRWQSKRLEIRREVLLAETRARGMMVLVEVVQLDDADALARSILPGREGWNGP